MQDVLEGCEIEHRSVITKPYNIEELSHIIRDVLSA